LNYVIDFLLKFELFVNKISLLLLSLDYEVGKRHGNEEKVIKVGEVRKLNYRGGGKEKN